MRGGWDAEGNTYVGGGSPAPHSFAARNALNGFPALLARQVEIIGALEVHPEIGRHAEVLRQAQGRVGGHVS